MDKPGQTPPYRTPPWYCCSFENLVVIFSLFPSHTILPTNLPDQRGVPPDGQRCLKHTQSTVLTGGSCRNHDLTTAWGPTYWADSPSSASMASSLALARLRCGGICAARPQA